MTTSYPLDKVESSHDRQGKRHAFSSHGVGTSNHGHGFRLRSASLLAASRLVVLVASSWVVMLVASSGLVMLMASNRLVVLVASSGHVVLTIGMLGLAITALVSDTRGFAGALAGAGRARLVGPALVGACCLVETRLSPGARRKLGENMRMAGLVSVMWWLLRVVRRLLSVMRRLLSVSWLLSIIRRLLSVSRLSGMNWLRGSRVSSVRRVVRMSWLLMRWPLISRERWLVKSEERWLVKRHVRKLGRLRMFVSIGTLDHLNRLFGLSRVFGLSRQGCVGGLLGMGRLASRSQLVDVCILCIRLRRNSLDEI